MQIANGSVPRMSRGSREGGKEWVEELIALAGRALCRGRLWAGLGLDRVPPTLGC